MSSSSSSFLPPNHINAVLPARRNKNKPSLPKAKSQSQPSRRSSVFTTIAISSAASIALHCTSISPLAGGGTGGGGTGGGGGGGGGGGWFGGGNSGNGGFWSQIFSPATAIADESPSEEWDSHGLQANIAVQLNKLSGFKKYKISNILFVDRKRKAKVASDDSFSEMVTLRPGGVYTRAQLQKELESLATSGMFEKVDLEGKTNPDGTLSVTVLFSESTWESADSFRCINVGMMQQTKPVEMDSDMTDKERMKYHLSQERDYKRRMEKARPCLLPRSVHQEILDMLKKQRSGLCSSGD